MDLDEIAIEPSQVIGVLFEKTEETPFVIARWMVMSLYQFQNDKRMSEGMHAVITCQGMDVAVIDNLEDTWRLGKVHCISPSHGTHPRYAELYARLYSRMASAPVKPCNQCDGSGWLEAGDPEANRLIVMSSVVKMYRGIRLEEDGYKPEDIDKGPLFGSVMGFLRTASMDDFSTRKEEADGEEKD